MQWPVGLGGKGNEGVAGAVKQTPGTIGYVELVYAHQNKLPTAHIKNAAGEYVSADDRQIRTAGEGASAALGADPDFRVSIINAPAPDAYPIASFTWLLVYTRPKDKQRARIMVEFMKVGAAGRPEVRERDRICLAALRASSPSRWKPSRRSSSDRTTRAILRPPRPKGAGDRSLRLGTGFFALLVLLLGARSGSSCSATDKFPIAKFGLAFWTSTSWNPVAGEFGARPFIRGTLYSSFLALLFHSGRARHRDLHLGFSPRGSRAPRGSARSCSPPSPPSCTGSGDLRARPAGGEAPGAGRRTGCARSRCSRARAGRRDALRRR